MTRAPARILLALILACFTCAADCWGEDPGGDDDDDWEADCWDGEDDDHDGRVDCDDPDCFGVQDCGDDDDATAEARTGDCAELPARSWSGLSGGSINCLNLQPLDGFVLDQLSTLWGWDASWVCVYDWSLGGYAVNECGPTPGPGAWACPVDSTIAWDFPFMNNQYVSQGDFAVVTIIAHEYGHLNQGVTGISFDPYVTNVEKELHADCQAGVFAAVQESLGILDGGDLKEAFSSLCAAGGAEAWYDPSGHGSCTERQGAFDWGHTNGSQALESLCGPDPLSAMRDICG